MNTHGNLKLTPEMVRQAGKLVVEGHRYKSLYRHFGVSDETWRTYLRHGNPAHPEEDSDPLAQQLKTALWEAISKGLQKRKTAALKAVKQSYQGRKLKKKKVVTKVLAHIESKTKPDPHDFKTQLWPVKEEDENDVFLIEQVITEETMETSPNWKAAVWDIERLERHEDMITNVSELPPELQELAKESWAALLREARTNPVAAEAFLKSLGKLSE